MRLPRRLEHGQPADLVDHLDELRTRPFISISIGAVAVAYAFHARVIGWLNAPLPADHRRPLTLGIAEPFTTSMKVSLAAGIALALPVVLWQARAYLAPAFARHLQRTLATCVAFASGLFVLGLAFAYRTALPGAVHFLTNYDNRLYDVQVRAQSYYAFALTALVSVGLVFEVPVFVVALVRLQIVTAERLRRGWRVGLAVMAVIGAALPGYDPVTTLMEMLPLMGL